MPPKKVWLPNKKGGREMKKYILIIFVSLMVILLVASPYYLKNEEVNNETNLTYLKIETNKNNYTFGEVVNISIYLVNEHDENITYSTGSDEFYIHIFNPNNTLVHYYPDADVDGIWDITVDANSEKLIFQYEWNTTETWDENGNNPDLQRSGQYRIYSHLLQEPLIEGETEIVIE